MTPSFHASKLLSGHSMTKPQNNCNEINYTGGLPFQRGVTEIITQVISAYRYVTFYKLYQKIKKVTHQRQMCIRDSFGIEWLDFGYVTVYVQIWQRQHVYTRTKYIYQRYNHKTHAHTHTHTHKHTHVLVGLYKSIHQLLVSNFYFVDICSLLGLQTSSSVVYYLRLWFLSHVLYLSTRTLCVMTFIVS